MVFLVAVVYGLVIAAVLATLVWLVRRAQGKGGFPVGLMGLLWAVATVAVLIWFMVGIAETT